MKMHDMLLSHLGLGNAMSKMEKSSFEVALKGKRKIAERTYEFVFEKPKGFHFNAGQHVRMTLLNPYETDSKGNSRFMTLANTPSEKNLIVAMRMTNSAFKRSLGQMKAGEKVLIQILLHSPHGSFVIHKDASTPAVFLVGGIGIVPAYSMIKDAVERKLPHKIFLFYSNRRPEDAPYLEDLQKLARQTPNFKLIATMTQMKKSNKAWKEETGFISETMLKRYIADLSSPIYYIAGLTEMVNAMKNLVKELGVKESNIRSEDFSGFKMSLINITNNPRGSRSHLLFAVIALIVILVLFAHLGLAFGLFNIISIHSLSSLTISSILAIIIFKVLVIFTFKHRLGKKNNTRGNL
jgi:ferredoxin-NADP reductase